MKITKLDYVVAMMSGLVCFGLLIKIPVWALFIGWTWYFVLGGTPEAIKKAIPAMIVGYILGMISIVVYAASNQNIFAMVGIMIITVFIMMLSLKIPFFSCSLASFNAYSCLFAGYYSGSFPAMQNSMIYDINNVIVAVLWIAMTNVLGLFCGYLSIKLSSDKE